MKNMVRVIQYRRKRVGKTDYRKRLALLKSHLPRLVVRASNKSIQAQLVQYNPDGDSVIATARATQLRKFGWKHPTANIPAAYLTGVLLADFAKKHITNHDVIIDIGLQKHHKGGRLYAVAKGARDGGLKVRCSDDVFPSDERLTGTHVSESLPAEVAAMKIKIMSENNA